MKRIFQLLSMKCCSRQIDWIDDRRPNYCPECGKTLIFMFGKDHPLDVLHSEVVDIKLKKAQS